MFNLNSNCSNLLDLRNLQEQVKKAFRDPILFRPFTVWTNCFSNLTKFSRWLKQFFLTVSQNNFGNKIPLLHRNITKETEKNIHLIFRSCLILAKNLTVVNLFWSIPCNNFKDQYLSLRKFFAFCSIFMSKIIRKV